MIKTVFHRLKWHVIGVAIMLAVLFVFYKALNRDNTPTFDTPQAFPETSVMNIKSNAQVTLKDLTQDLAIVHVWASWCGVCIKEHKTWMKIHDQWPYPIVGIVYRDNADIVSRFLEKEGSPYEWILHDEEGHLGIELGLVGTPQTYIVDKNGVIQFLHVGMINERIFKEKFLPVIEKLKS